ncbi:TVP38/TMEM64 family protein [Gordonia rubripertincta]|uniref:TVP38/TMEM64 family membrane protein n=1 Tax=Gordonia rubripertincta TaxID=36822 RepID=A0AAW6RBG4_GORRU|nr:TVP38/TMEM64 family protein [Gordonia rubripertincta]MDG6782147.1 TVP38/TMEM64 family protein [Gordonia rubripertincta]
MKLAILAAVMVAGVVVAATVDIPDSTTIRDSVSAAGVPGVLAFMLILAALTLTPFPMSVLTVAGGLMFGLVPGALIVIVAATFGAWAGYWLARSLGRASFAQISWSRIVALNAVLERRGMSSMMVVRLIPVFPFGLVNYAAGLSSVRQRDYLVGTAIGIVPGAIAYSAVGAYGTSPLSWPFVAAIAAVVVIGGGSAVLARRLGVTGSIRGNQTPV